jgi:hypothetical protein
MDKITLILTKEHISILGDALLDQPARKTLDLINEINFQIKEQVKKQTKE